MAEQLRDWIGNLPAFVGDLPTWIAVAAAIYAGIHAGRLLKIENKRDREREARDAQRDAAERQQQANLVAAWRGVVPVHLDAVDGTLDSTIGTYGPVVRNASELPIYQAKVEIMPIGTSAGARVYVYEVLPPGQWFVRVEDGALYATRPVVLHPRHKDVPEYQVAVSFRDAAGNVWKRGVNGDLRQTGRVVFGQMTATLPALVGRARGGPVQATGWRHPWFPRRKAPS